LISSLSEDALDAVPRALREGSYALGAGRLPTITRVVVPSAFSGIAAAVTLAVSRAIGETMVVTIAAGQQPNFTLDPRVPIQTMTSYVASISKGDVPYGSLAHRALFAVGATLFVMTLAMNLVSYRMARRIRRRSGT
jgi:phosphate transport system permease protein